MTIFEFWQPAGILAQHPADALIFERAGFRFEERSLPSPMMGRLSTAPVVLLFLSPGKGPEDERHATTIKGQGYYERMRSGQSPLPTRDEHESAFAWWTQNARHLGVNTDDANELAAARDGLAVFDLCPYHSQPFSDFKILPALPTTHAAILWAQTELFPQAEAGKRIVICLRAAREWGLRVGYQQGQLFAPRVNRRGYIICPQRRAEIRRAVREALGLQPIVPDDLPVMSDQGVDAANSADDRFTDSPRPEIPRG